MFVIIVTINLVKDYFLIGSFIMVKYFCFCFFSVEKKSRWLFRVYGGVDEAWERRRK